MTNLKILKVGKTLFQVLSPISKLESFAKQLELSLGPTTATTTTPHVSLILTEPSSLVGRFLNSGCVHQMECALIFFMIVSILTS